jgi:dienelactone hydrolase
MHPSVIPHPEREIELPADGGRLGGTLVVPAGAVGLVLFAHGSGSSRNSPRNRRVAAALQAAGLATLLFDLLTEREEAIDRYTAHFRFDIGLLTRRLVAAIDWMAHEPEVEGLQFGCFGSSTGAAAALVAAAERPQRVGAVVSRGGRPDLAGAALARVAAPTLLIVGGEDAPVLGLNRRAMAEMACPARLEVVPGATHLFEEPGALERVAGLAAEWFRRHLAAATEAVVLDLPVTAAEPSRAAHA